MLSAEIYWALPGADEHVVQLGLEQVKDTKKPTRALNLVGKRDTCPFTALSDRNLISLPNLIIANISCRLYVFFPYSLACFVQHQQSSTTISESDLVSIGLNSYLPIYH